MGNLEQRVLRKGIDKVDSYMISLGFQSCLIGPDRKVTYCNNPRLNDISVVFSEKGRAKEVIRENSKI